MLAYSLPILLISLVGMVNEVADKILIKYLTPIPSAETLADIDMTGEEYALWQLGIYGANFNHESETPGLGALIVELPFRQQFEGKHIRNAEGEIVSVAVLKAGTTAEGQEQVDALSGATITSTGVSDMLRTNLGEYADFLNVKHCCGHCKKHGEGECCHKHGEGECQHQCGGQCQHHAEEATEAQIGE